VMISLRPTAVYLDRTWKIMIVVMINAAMWMKSVAVQVSWRSKGYNTSLEDECIRDLDVSSITDGFDAILGTDEGTQG
jgi:hypothetical protein